MSTKFIVLKTYPIIQSLQFDRTEECIAEGSPMTLAYR